MPELILEATDVGRIAPDPAPSRWRALRRLTANPYTPLLTLWLVVLVYFVSTQENFLNPANISSMLQQNAVLFVVAMAMTVILISGAVDLSIGGMVALTGLVLPLSNVGVPPWLTIVLALVAGTLLSAIVNGLPTGLAGMSPFVVTLGTAALFTGAANVLTGGKTQIIQDPSLLRFFSSSRLGPIPVAAVLMALLLLAFWLMLRYTYFGRNVYAVGGNAEAARLAGISTPRVRIAAFALLGLTAGIAACLQAGQLSSVAPTAGIGLELQAVAAVLLGGTSLMGGKGSVVGTAIAVLFLGTVKNGLDLSGVSAFWQGIVSGSILVLAVGFDQARQHLSARSASNGQQ